MISQDNLNNVLSHRQQFDSLIAHISTFHADGILSQAFLDKLTSQNNLERFRSLLKYVPHATWADTKLLSSTMDELFDCNTKLGDHEISPNSTQYFDYSLDRVRFYTILDKCKSASTSKAVADIFNYEELPPLPSDLPTWRNIVAILRNKNLNTPENFNKILENKDYKKLLNTLKTYAWPVLSSIRGNDVYGVFNQQFLDKLTSADIDLAKFECLTNLIPDKTWADTSSLTSTLNEILDASSQTFSPQQITSGNMPILPFLLEKNMEIQANNSNLISSLTLPESNEIANNDANCNLTLFGLGLAYAANKFFFKTKLDIKSKFTTESIEQFKLKKINSIAQQRNDAEEAYSKNYGNR